MSLVSAPCCRAVAPTMMSGEEQAALRAAGRAMVHYGLRYCFDPFPTAGLPPLQLPVAPSAVSGGWGGQ